MSAWITEAGYPVIMVLIGAAFGYMIRCGQDRRKG